MNDRTRAIAILREAKQILADRLTERVLEAGEDILADARGDSYMNEIDSVYEQVGMKLAHVNQMLSNLPLEDETEPATAAAQFAEGDAFTATTSDAASFQPIIVTDTTAALPGPVYSPTPALPAPRSTTPHETEPSPALPRSFQTFAAEIQAGDLLAAGQSLASILGLEEGRAFACATVFADRMRRDAGFLRRAMQLRAEITDGGYDRAIALLYDCFGLSASESIAVLQSLRRRLNLEH